MNGDRLEIEEHAEIPVAPSRFISSAVIPRYSSFPTLRVTAGYEFEHLSAASRDDFEKQEYAVTSRSDRMGFRLEGKPLILKKRVDMISSAVNFGTIQLLPDGQMVILMADHQTAGGYPRIAHVIERDLSVAAQLGSGDNVAFHIVTLAEAEALYFEQQRDLSLLRTACSGKDR